MSWRRRKAVGSTFIEEVYLEITYSFDIVYRKYYFINYRILICICVILL